VVVGVFIAFDKLLLLLIDILSVFVMYDELGKNFPHEIVVFLDEALLFELFVGAAEVACVGLFAGHVLEDAFHVLVVLGEGELGEGNHFELLAGRLLQVAHVGFDHAVKLLQVGDWLEVAEREFGRTGVHNKNIIIGEHY
jgi:hypothetical protein